MVEKLFEKLKERENFKEAKEIVFEILDYKEEAVTFFENELKIIISNSKLGIITNEDKHYFEIIFLLFELDSTKSLELILEFLTFDIEDEIREVILNSTWLVISKLGRKEPEKLIEFVKNKKNDIYSRSAVSKSLPYVAISNKELKKQIQQMFQNILNDKNEDIKFKYLLINPISELGAKDLLKDCKKILIKMKLKEEIKHLVFEEVKELPEIHLWDIYEMLANYRPKLMENKEGKVQENLFDYEFEHPIHNTKIGRNEPCPCDSGKKYKKCCGK